MIKQLEKLESRYRELENLLASPEVISNKEEYNRYAKELSDMRDAVYLFREYLRVSQEMEGLQQLIKGKAEQEFLELARTELADLSVKKSNLEEKLKECIAADDDDLGKDVIVEIRQGTGGSGGGVVCGRPLPDVRQVR